MQENLNTSIVLGSVNRIKGCPEITGEKKGQVLPTHSISLVATKTGLDNRTSGIFLELESQAGSND